MSILDSLTCETADLGQENIKKLLALFPECACESGQVDFDKLKQALSSEVLEGDVERYQFTWPGKRKAMAAANAKTTKTLRPCREESVNFDTTENLYIEGDNLEALKLLQAGYAGKVKMIYIDPPYNTGKDFVYRDRFSLSDKEVADAAGAFDADGNRYEKNDSTEARYHTNWCNMMYPRLKLARELLSDGGVIFISMDDDEQVNLRKICDEVFGVSNFVEMLIWKKLYGGKSDTQWFSHYHDYILVYSKIKEKWSPNLLPRTEKQNDRYKNPDNDPRGPWTSADFSQFGPTPNCVYEIITPNGTSYYPKKGKRWITTYESYLKLCEENRLWFGENGGNMPRLKRYLSEVKNGINQSSILDFSEVGHNDEANKELRGLLGGKYFDYPKPIRLLYRLLYLALSNDEIVLDFFSGSATTAHAVMQLNAEDGGNRKFILVQLPEATEEKSEAYAAGYKTICEIGKERIRRAGKKIQDENPLTTKNLDVGFRVLKIDSSSINDVAARVDEQTQEFNFETDRIKTDRSSEDLLFQVLLQTQLPLSESITRETICGNEVFTVGGVMMACLDAQAKLTEEFFTALAQRKPDFAFFRDDSFADDNARINLVQIFKQFSKDTKIKVL